MRTFCFILTLLGVWLTLNALFFPIPDYLSKRAEPYEQLRTELFKKAPVLNHIFPAPKEKPTDWMYRSEDDLFAIRTIRSVIAFTALIAFFAAHVFTKDDFRARDHPIG